VQDNKTNPHPPGWGKASYGERRTQLFEVLGIRAMITDQTDVQVCLIGLEFFLAFPKDATRGILERASEA
jgi:hypothetical protein